MLPQAASVRVGFFLTKNDEKLRYFDLSYAQVMLIFKNILNIQII